LIYLGFITEGKLVAVLIKPSLGVSNWPAIYIINTAPPVTPRNIQEVQASKLGEAQGTPSSSTKISDHLSRHYIFIASYAMCFSWSVFIFAFSFLLFCLLK
jgi:hypothetical protein